MQIKITSLCLSLTLMLQPGLSILRAEINNKTLAVLVNKNDKESIEIGSYYQRARLIPAQNIIYLNLTPNVDSLSENQFNEIESQIKHKVSEDIQAYVITWRKPWRVGCMSITSAISLGFDKEYCAQSCKKTKTIDYYNSQSNQPYTDYGIRPSMMLSANSLDNVKQLIDRGLLADYMRPKGTAYLLSTGDIERNVRAKYYPVIKKMLGRLVNIEIITADAILNRNDIMFYFTGQKKVKSINDNNYLPGAIADHLTSSGGQLFNGSQMSVLDWIDAGVTGTYGTVVEPCNYVHKFPDPRIVMLKYLSGDTLLEAYWKSVRMPGQGVFIGEPLAAPFKGCKIDLNQQNSLLYVKIFPQNFVENKYRNCN